jgi:hypothetical protein
LPASTSSTTPHRLSRHAHTSSPLCSLPSPPAEAGPAPGAGHLPRAAQAAAGARDIWARGHARHQRLLGLVGHGEKTWWGFSFGFSSRWIVYSIFFHVSHFKTYY